MERGPSKKGASGPPMDEREYLASQPPARHVEGAVGEIRRRVAESGRRVVVLDDDPTGVQSVHGVPVVPLGVDQFGQSGSRADLYGLAGIDAAQIVNAAMLALELAEER